MGRRSTAVLYLLISVITLGALLALLSPPFLDAAPDQAPGSEAILAAPTPTPTPIPGGALAWGSNAERQLGDGTEAPAYTPVEVLGPGGVGTLQGVLAMAGGNAHTLALMADGRVMAWGDNSAGQLGIGEFGGKQLTPVHVKDPDVETKDLTGVVAIAAGEFYSLALVERQDGTTTLLAWGVNGGSLGDGTTQPRNRPVRVMDPDGTKPLAGVTAVAAGRFHSLAAQRQGDTSVVLAWGRNQNGQLGQGGITDEDFHPLPREVAGTRGKVVHAAAGAVHSLALRDGVVLAWGSNSDGELGDPSIPLGPRTTPVVVKDPKISANPLKGVVALSGGEFTSLALKSDGTVWAWGDNAAGQLGIGSTDSNPHPQPVQVEGLGTGKVVDIASGLGHNLALKADGTVLAWGGSDEGTLGNGTLAERATPVQVAGLGKGSGAVAIGAGERMSYAVSTKVPSPPGGARSWGANFFGQLGIDSADPNRHPLPLDVVGPGQVVAVAGGESHSLARRADDTVLAWGWNGVGQLGIGTTDGNPHSRPTPVKDPNGVDDLAYIRAIAAGEAHSLALKSDGSVLAWGSNGSGQLGDNSNQDRELPVLVPDPDSPTFPLGVVRAIAAGLGHSLARLSDGSVWAWGDNSLDQLGEGTDEASSPIPVQVKGLGPESEVFAIAAGGFHNLALKADGTVVAWGDNSLGQLGTWRTGGGSNVPVQVKDPNDQTKPLRGVVAIAAGYLHSLALREDGTVVAWGSNADGQLGNGKTGGSSGRPVRSSLFGLGSVVAIAAGGAHSLARTSEGTLLSWGRDDYGQLGRGSGSSPGTPKEVLDRNGVLLAGVTAIGGGGFHSLAVSTGGVLVGPVALSVLRISAVNKMSSQASSPGGVIDYTVAVNLTFEESEVVVEDLFQDGVDLVPGSVKRNGEVAPDPVLVLSKPGRILYRFDPGDLPVGETTLTFQGRVDPNKQCQGQRVRNSADLYIGGVRKDQSDVDTSVVCPTPTPIGTPTSTPTATPLPLRFANVSKVTSRPRAVPGGEIEYTVVVSLGMPRSQVVVEELFLYGVDLVTGSSRVNGAAIPDPTLLVSQLNRILYRFDLGALPAGETLLTFRGRVDPNKQCRGQKVRNGAHLYIGRVRVDQADVDTSLECPMATPTATPTVPPTRTPIATRTPTATATVTATPTAGP